MATISRFKVCKDCARNELEGFFGPPECDLAVVPEPDGSCKHHTTEMVVVVPPSPVVAIRKQALVAALALLKPVASRSRFAGSQPIMVAVGQNSLELRAVDGETDVRLGIGVLGPHAKRTVVPLEVFLAAAETDPVKIEMPEAALSVNGTGVVGVTATTLPGPFEVGDSGALVEVPPLPESCTYLVRAISRDEARPTLRYVLLEVPDFNFVATDGHRLHVQWAKPQNRERLQAGTNILLTKEQLALLWESKLAEKQLAVTDRGCVVTGALDGLHVDMAFTTGTGQFPPWRTLLDFYQHSVKFEIGAVRKMIREEGPLFVVDDTVQILKEHLSDAIVGWVDAEVEFKYKDAESPVLVEGSDKQAVVIHAKEVVVEQPVAQEVPVMAKVKRKKGAVQTSAQDGADALVQKYNVGQTIETPNGAIEIQKGRICYLVRMPDGKRRWFNQHGVKQLVEGQAAVAEDPNEAAA